MTDNEPLADWRIPPDVTSGFIINNQMRLFTVAGLLRCCLISSFRL